MAVLLQLSPSVSRGKAGAARINRSLAAKEKMRQDRKGTDLSRKPRAEEPHSITEVELM
jgi:hypothetical protein